jgi:hypothetical protein
MIGPRHAPSSNAVARRSTSLGWMIFPMHLTMRPPVCYLGVDLFMITMPYSSKGRSPPRLEANLKAGWASGGRTQSPGVAGAGGAALSGGVPVGCPC